MYGFGGQIDYSLLVPVIVPVCVGAWLGARAAMRIGGERLRWVYLLIGSATALKLLSELVRGGTMKKIHLIYRRIPNRVLERDDEVISDLGDVIVAKSRFSGMLAPLRVNGVEVIRNGYNMLYFAFVGENYDVLKVYDEEGNFKGLYIDVLAYSKREGDTLKMLDIFLDIFVFPDGGAFLLDEDELEMALNYGLIDKGTFDFAYSIARDIFEKLKRGEFPPEIVWEYEWGD